MSDLSQYQTEVEQLSTSDLIHFYTEAIIIEAQFITGQRKSLSDYKAGTIATGKQSVTITKSTLSEDRAGNLAKAKIVYNEMRSRLDRATT